MWLWWSSIYMLRAGWYTWSPCLPNLDVVVDLPSTFCKTKKRSTCVQLIYITMDIDDFELYVVPSRNILLIGSTYCQMFFHHSFFRIPVQNEGRKLGCFLKITLVSNLQFKIWLHQIVGKSLTNRHTYTLFGLFSKMKATDLNMLFQWLATP